MALVPTLRVLDLTKNCDLKTDPLLITNICAKTPLLEELILKDCRLIAEIFLCLKKTMPWLWALPFFEDRGSRAWLYMYFPHSTSNCCIARSFLCQWCSKYFRWSGCFVDRECSTKRSCVWYVYHGQWHPSRVYILMDIKVSKETPFSGCTLSIAQTISFINFAYLSLFDLTQKTFNWLTLRGASMVGHLMNMSKNNDRNIWNAQDPDQIDYWILSMLQLYPSKFE